MGIAERRYDEGRGERRQRVGGLHLVSFNTWLIVINTVVFLLCLSPLGKFIQQFGHFSTFEVISKLEFWRVVTFQFLHANATHLIFNMLGLYMFGEMVEQRLGFKKYAAFYLVCGIFGSLMYLTLNVLGSVALRMNVVGIPGLLYPADASTLFSNSQLVGASAGVFGVIVASAYLAPNSEVELVMVPIPIKLRVFAYGYVLVSLVSLLMNTRNAGGEAAHMGGAIAGFFFIRRSHLLADFFDVFTDSRSPGRPPARPKRSGLGKLFAPRVPATAEVDRILDKLRDGGLASLTEAEKDSLRRATDARQD